MAAGDRARLERVCRYGLRPPVAHERIERLPSGNLAYRMKRTSPDGATHRVMSRWNSSLRWRLLSRRLASI
jgi:hypothetical protein